MAPVIPEAENLPDEHPRCPLIDESTGEPVLAPWSDDISVYRLDLGGTFLSYVDVGEGPPVVLIPGWIGTTLNFAPQIEALSHRYRVLSFDPIGSGYSDRPSIAYAPVDHFRFARRFIEKLRVWPAVIVGHSMGGAVGYALAADNPELVEALVLISPRTPVPSGEPLSGRLFRRGAKRFPKAIERLTARALDAGAARIAKANVPSDVFTDPAKARSALTAIAKSRGWSRAAARTLLQMDDWSQWSGRLAEIEVPAMLIWGSRDKVNPVENKSEITAELPDIAVEIIDGAGHLPMLEAPDATTSALERFVARARQ